MLSKTYSHGTKNRFYQIIRKLLVGSLNWIFGREYTDRYILGVTVTIFLGVLVSNLVKFEEMNRNKLNILVIQLGVIWCADRLSLMIYYALAITVDD